MFVLVLVVDWVAGVFEEYTGCGGRVWIVDSDGERTSSDAQDYEPGVLALESHGSYVLLILLVNHTV